MHVESLRCVTCEASFSPDAPQYVCDCGASLDVVYDYGTMDVSWPDLRQRPFNHTRYSAFLPALSDKDIVELVAGGTPLLPAQTVGDELDLYLKLESGNPTGSFKDRGTAVELGVAQRFGADEIVVASTGNMGASIAAYTARASVDATIYVPADVRGPKRKQMESHGADIITVDGDYAAAAEQAWNRYEEHGTYLMGDYPYRGEGEKTVGHEIMDQVVADTIVVPVGNGTLLHGVWKGCRELQRAGLREAVPRLIGVQAAGCNTVVKALNSEASQVDPVDEVDTVAGAMACGNPLDGDQALAALQESDGAGVVVTDEEILAAKQLLAEKEGVYAEEAGAAAFAGVLKDSDLFEDEETVVCLVTGHGLKT